MAAALAAGNALVALVRLPAGRAAPTGAPEPRTGGLASWGLAGPAVRRLAGLAMVAMVGFAGFEATFALLVERRFPEVGDPTVYGLFASIGLMMVFVQARIVGPANARLGTRPTLRTSLVLVAAGMVVLAAGGGWFGLAVALVLLVTGQGVFGPTLSNATVETVPIEGRGAALGLQQGAGASGRILGPLLAGLLFDRVGVEAPYLVAAALALAALVLVRRADR